MFILILTYLCLLELDATLLLCSQLWHCRQWSKRPEKQFAVDGWTKFNGQNMGNILDLYNGLITFVETKLSWEEFSFTNTILLLSWAVLVMSLNTFINVWTLGANNITSMQPRISAASILLNSTCRSWSTLLLTWSATYVVGNSIIYI